MKEDASDNNNGTLTASLFGIMVYPDGRTERVCFGSFDAGVAEKLSSELTLLATDIRITARGCFSKTEK